MKSFACSKEGFNFFDKNKILLSLLLFLLVFPKGGFKIGDVPITWGYLLLGLFSFSALFRNTFSTTKRRLFMLMALLPFQILSATTIFLNGIADKGMTLSFLICFFFLPFAFLFLFSQDIEEIDEDFFLYYFVRGIRCIAIYGIFLFLFKWISGKFIEIPFLTVNLGDLGNLETKNINRGSIFKLISTYNNGNIYGISLLMLTPLYCLVEKRRAMTFLLKLSLILTLARTIWIGLLLYEILSRFVIPQKKKTRLLATFFSLIFFTFIFSLFFYYGFNLDFILDSNLGGRRDQLLTFYETGFFSSEPFGGIPEIVYAGIVQSFGWVGLLFFLLAMASPLLMILIFTKRGSLVKKSTSFGLFLYLFLCLSDGAILLMPVLAFFWFLASFLAKKELHKSSRADQSTSSDPEICPSLR